MQSWDCSSHPTGNTNKNGLDAERPTVKLLGENLHISENKFVEKE